MTNNDTGLILCKKIMQSYPYRFVGALVLGRRGIGKSCYSLITMHEIYSKFGYDDTTAWNMALDHCLFSLNDIIEFLENTTRSETKEYVLTCDDVGIHMNPMSYFSNMKRVEKLKGLMDIIREAVSGLIMTTPSQSGILKFLRSYDDYLIQIKYSSRGGDYRDAVGYLRYTLPSGKRLVFKKFVDHYRPHLPDWVFGEYSKKRKHCYINMIDELKETVE